MISLIDGTLRILVLELIASTILVGTLRNGNQLEFCAKILKVRTYSLLLLSKSTPPAKTLSCLELGDVVITQRLSLAEY
jgi:hypothetical protein